MIVLYTYYIGKNKIHIAVVFYLTEKTNGFTINYIVQSVLRSHFS